MSEKLTGEDLGEIRDQIDEVDRSIVTLLNRRMKLALAAGATKLMESKAVMDYPREDDVLRKVDAVNQELDGPLTQEDLFGVYLDIFRRSREAQRAARENLSSEVKDIPAELKVASYVPGVSKQ